MVDESSIKKWTRVQVDDRSEVDKKSVFDDRREFIHRVDLPGYEMEILTLKSQKNSFL